MAGFSRDVVFAFTEELDSWLRHHESAADDERSDDLATPVVATTDAPGTGFPPPAGADARAGKAGMLVIAAALVGALVVAVWLVRTMATREGADVLKSGGPADATHEATAPRAAGVSRRIRISVPGQSPFELELVDGVCGGVELEPPQWLELCTRPRGDRLLLEARILPARASVGTRAAQHSLNVALEHDSQVRIEAPVPLDVEWLTTVREPPANAPPDRR
jgi:hypothetical protein